MLEEKSHRFSKKSNKNQFYHTLRNSPLELVGVSSGKVGIKFERLNIFPVLAGLGGWYGGLGLK